MEQISADSDAVDLGAGENAVTDDRLPMMFTSCHPLIPQEMQVALALKTSEYHLLAAIAACHAAAPEYEFTDWRRILSLYDRLIAMDNSPVVALNRAVAVANVHGARAGIQAVEAIHDRQQLNGYYLLYAVLGEFKADLDHREAAMSHFRKALELATMKSEQNFLTKKIQEIRQPSEGSPD